MFERVTFSVDMRHQKKKKLTIVVNLSVASESTALLEIILVYKSYFIKRRQYYQMAEIFVRCE